MRTRPPGAAMHQFKETASAGRSDAASTQKLIEDCQGLVRSLAWKIHQKLPPHVEFDDLLAFGQVGLVEAARDFDPSRAKFTTYAYYRVRGAIFDGLSRMGWFSRHHYHASRYEHMANELLRLESGSENEPENLEGGVRWIKGVTSSLAVVHLMTSDDDETGHDLADERARDPEAVAIENEMKVQLDRLIEALPSDAGRLVRAVYNEGVTLQEAANRLGISKAWASRLHGRTLQRLAHSLRLLGAAD
jgi:RNA polymerase sigma factor for flagellar operon FliA